MVTSHISETDQLCDLAEVNQTFWVVFPHLKILLTSHVIIVKL